MSSLTASLFFLRQCLSLNPELTVLGRLAGQQGPTMNLFLISWCLGCSCINILSMWVLDLLSEDILLTRPSPLP